MRSSPSQTVQPMGKRNLAAALVQILQSNQKLYKLTGIQAAASLFRRQARAMTGKHLYLWHVGTRLTRRQVNRNRHGSMDTSKYIHQQSTKTVNHQSRSAHRVSEHVRIHDCIWYEVTYNTDHLRFVTVLAYEDAAEDRIFNRKQTTGNSKHCWVICMNCIVNYTRH